MHAREWCLQRDANWSLWFVGTAQAWKQVSGAQLVLNSKADHFFYAEELRKSFGRSEVPVRCSPMPTFGFVVIIAMLSKKCRC